MQHIYTLVYTIAGLALLVPFVHAGPTAVIPDFPKAGSMTVVAYDPETAVFEEVAVRAPADAAVDAALFVAGSAADVAAALEAGASVHARQGELGVTPLHNAPSVAVAEALLDAGADPNARNTYDMTPLHNQVIRRRVEVVQLLLEAGALASAQDFRGDTALDWVHPPRWGILPSSPEMRALLQEALAAEMAEDNPE